MLGALCAERIIDGVQCHISLSGPFISDPAQEVTGILVAPSLGLHREHLHCICPPKNRRLGSLAASER